MHGFVNEPLGVSNGKSGADLSIETIGSKLYVVKKSPNKEYNQRLECQIRKQMAFKGEFLRVPHIIEMKMVDEKLQFAMEYIHAQPLSAALINSSLQVFSQVLEALFRHIDYCREHCVKSSVLLSHAVEKKNSELSKYLNNTPFSRDELGRILFLLSNPPEVYINYTHGCHGDLTLDNILVDNQQNIYLIDFLDSFVESYVVDIAKLLQDIQVGWAYRNMSHDDMSIMAPRLAIAKQIIYKSISNKYSRSEIIAINYILFINTLRILPYASREDLGFLKRSIIRLSGSLNME